MIIKGITVNNHLTFWKPVNIFFCHYGWLLSLPNNLNHQINWSDSAVLFMAKNFMIQFTGTFYIVTKNHTDVIPPVISEIQTYIWNSTFCQFLIIIKSLKKCCKEMFLNFCTTVIFEGFCQNLECHVVIFWYPCSYLRAPVFTFQGNYGLKILPMKSTGKFDKLKLLGKNMNKS